MVVTEHEGNPAGGSRRPQVVLGVIAVAVVATWWGWPPSLVEVGPVAAVPADSGMVAVLAALRDRMAEADAYLGRRPLETARRELQSLPPDASSRTRIGLLWSVGHHHLRLGENRLATERLVEAIELVSRLDPPL